jgi:hypothetical protein
MVELSEIVKVTGEVIKQLSDLVGIIEKNLSSLDEIKERFRRKRIVARLQEILGEVMSWENQGWDSLWKVAERIDQAPSRDMRKFDNIIWKSDIKIYLEMLSASMELIDQYKNDIVSVDYRLYESIENVAGGRIDALQALSKEGGYEISVEKLRELNRSYMLLKVSLGKLKDDIQHARRKVTKNEPISICWREPDKPKKK